MPAGYFERTIEDILVGRAGLPIVLQWFAPGAATHCLIGREDEDADH